MKTYKNKIKLFFPLIPLAVALSAGASSDRLVVVHQGGQFFIESRAIKPKASAAEQAVKTAGEWSGMADKAKTQKPEGAGKIFFQLKSLFQGNRDAANNE